ncbi:MAG TPA: SLATT domain-containing protein [Xanthomonadaceae bacterium]
MTPNELISHWRFRAHRMQLAHYKTARAFDARHFWLGLPAIALSTIVGTTVFASLSNNTETYIQIAVGLSSVIAALLTALQTFLKYSELSEKHRVAGAKFANLKHRIELLASFAEPPPDELKQQLVVIEERWEKIREESPNLPTRMWSGVEKSLTYEEHNRRYLGSDA